MTRVRSFRIGGRALVAALALITSALLGACSDDDAPSVLDALAPTRADIAAGGGIHFPASVDDFRLTRISSGQIDVTFTLDAADVEEFTSRTGVELTSGTRAITHASPLWDVAVPGPVEGGTSTRQGVTRQVEVLPAGDTATVRLSLVQNAGS